MAGASSGIRLQSWIVIFFVIMTNVGAEEAVVLTWEVTAGGTTKTFNFSQEKLIEFYDYLCNASTYSLHIYRDDNDLVSSFDEETIRENQNSYSRRYRCQRKFSWFFANDYYLLCERQKYSDAGCKTTRNCSSINVFDQTLTACNNYVEIIWNRWQALHYYHDDNFLDIHTYVADCEAITTSTSAFVTSQETKTTTVNQIFTTSLTVVRTTTTATTTTSPLVENEDQENTSVITIGVVVSLLVITAILVVLLLVIWRRKRNAANGKSSSADHTETSATNLTYSVAFQNVNDTTTQGQTVPNNVSDMSPYHYAVIDPVKKVRSNNDAIASNTEDREYYNQDAVEGNPQSSSVNTSSLTAGQRDPDYYNLDNDQNGAIPAITSDVSPPLTAISDSQDSGNVYSVTHDTKHTVDGTYSVIDDHTTKSKGSINPHHSNNYNTPANAEYAQANPAMSALGSEYSKLHDPIRHIKDPYNILLPSKSEGNQAASTTPIPSAYPDSAPFTYSLAQPFLKEPTSHTQPVDVIDVGSLSQHSQWKATESSCI